MAISCAWYAKTFYRLPRPKPTSLTPLTDRKPFYPRPWLGPDPSVLFHSGVRTERMVLILHGYIK